MKRKKKLIIALFVIAAAVGVVTKLYDKATLQKKADSSVQKIKTEAAEFVEEIPMFQETVSASETQQQIPADDIVNVTFIDVGQGDSTLITTNGTTILIDTGAYEAYNNVQSVLSENNVSTIDLLVLTHPDADHIQNSDEIIQNYEVNQIMMPNVTKDTKSFEQLGNAISSYNIPVISPNPGDVFTVGNAKMEVLGPPQGAEYEDTNSYSIILKMVHGQNKFLFLGDATGEEIDALYGADFSADVYKAAHHGSANCGCNSEWLLNASDPEYMVISCAYQNEYGHPHRETMDYASKYGLKLYRTDLQGSVSCISDGEQLMWSTYPSTNYICGSDE